MAAKYKCNWNVHYGPVAGSAKEYKAGDDIVIAKEHLDELVKSGAVSEVKKAKGEE